MISPTGSTQTSATNTSKKKYPGLRPQVHEDDWIEYDGYDTFDESLLADAGKKAHTGGDTEEVFRTQLRLENGKSAGAAFMRAQARSHMRR